jgi:adenosylcobinamide kinase/adenosylcobinamide-phosphate guanylyltransferase
MAGRQLVLVGGGVRSGKSAFALERARALGGRLVFVATAEALDDEMRERVSRHRLERGAVFQTLEEPRDLVARLRELRDVDAVVIDCLTLWLSNLLIDGLSRDAVEARTLELAEHLAQSPYHSVVVSNEVGLGIVPDNALARAFRDVTGRAHQQLGARASEIYFAALGQLLRLKPGPVGLVE